MAISIITPHYNDPEGLFRISGSLSQQTSSGWEWLIVDDCSEIEVRKKLNAFFDELGDDRIRLIFNDEKTNASVCRNRGSESAQNASLVFLDSDDEITAQFVQNRSVQPTDFTVFQNHGIKGSDGEVIHSKPPADNQLNYYLSARFIWHTTSITWNKDFFNSIGRFNPKLPRLQDVELVIRALQNSDRFSIVENEVDFHYNVQPLRSRQNLLQPVCDAIHIFISELIDFSELTKAQIQLLKGYYFVCAKYLERSENRSATGMVKKNLRLFNKLKLISFPDYFIGLILLQLYRLRVIGGNTFLKVNRYMFKPTETAIRQSG